MDMWVVVVVLRNRLLASDPTKLNTSRSQVLLRSSEIRQKNEERLHSLLNAGMSQAKSTCVSR